MGSREAAIQAAGRATGAPSRRGYIAEVLDAANEAGYIHYADECPAAAVRKASTRSHVEELQKAREAVGPVIDYLEALDHREPHVHAMRLRYLFNEIGGFEDG